MASCVLTAENDSAKLAAIDCVTGGAQNPREWILPKIKRLKLMPLSSSTIAKCISKPPYEFLLQDFQGCEFMKVLLQVMELATAYHTCVPLGSETTNQWLFKRVGSDYSEATIQTQGYRRFSNLNFERGKGHKSWSSDKRFEVWALMVVRFR